MDNQMMIFENKEDEVFELEGKVYFNNINEIEIDNVMYCNVY